VIFDARKPRNRRSRGGVVNTITEARLSPPFGRRLKEGQVPPEARPAAGHAEGGHFRTKPTSTTNRPGGIASSISTLIGGFRLASRRSERGDRQVAKKDGSTLKKQTDKRENDNYGWVKFTGVRKEGGATEKAQTVLEQTRPERI